MLFAYDAMAFYIWQLSELKKEKKTSMELKDALKDGKALGAWAKNKKCKHGR